MSEAVRQLAVRFLEALRAGDEQTLWDTLSAPAQTRILDIGDRVGIPADITSRIRIGTASDTERARVLGDVLDGVRADLQGADLGRLDVEILEATNTTARVGLVQAVSASPGFALPPIPAAWLTIGLTEGSWLIDDVIVPK